MLNELHEMVFITKNNSKSTTTPNSRATMSKSAMDIDTTNGRNSVRDGQPSSQVAIATNAAAYILPQARKKIKLKVDEEEEEKEMMNQQTTKNLINAIETNNCTKKPPSEPQGAFFFPHVTTRSLSLLVVSILMLVQCIVTADASKTSETSSIHRHYLTNRQLRDNQQKLQQNKLRYLIAKTSLLPQWVDHARYNHQRHTYHMDNNIINHINDISHPSSVHHIGSEAPVTETRQRSKSTNGLRREPFFGRINAELQRNHGELSANDVDPGVRDFDSLDSELMYPGADDANDIEDDVDDEKEDDADVDDEEDDEGDEEEETDELDSEDYVTLFNGDSINSNDDLNTIRLNEDIANKKYRKLPHLHSAMPNGQPRRKDHPYKSENTSINELANHSSTQNFNKPLMRPRWGRDSNEVGPRSHGMIIATTPDQLEEDSYEQQAHKLQPKHKSQPPAPYQSPVVVSISDNSFVSASPISMGAISVNDGVDVVEGPQSSERTTVHYSHIIAGPKNELPSYGRRYWHDSHMASIQMVQEEHNDLQQGGLNSAIIAILFGIGVTGTLIMIVSIKMRSIRERVAYKGRRRSLVPDTDFLINTIPM